VAIRADYDREADALYVTVNDVAVAGTVEQDHSISVDVDGEGNVVGIEVISPRRNLAKLPIVAQKIGFLEQLGAVATACRDALGSSTSAADVSTTIAQFNVGLTGVGAVGAAVASGSFSVGTSFSSRDIDADLSGAVRELA
jgi:uncharacterized protein YuzE